MDIDYENENVKEMKAKVKTYEELKSNIEKKNQEFYENTEEKKDQTKISKQI